MAAAAWPGPAGPWVIESLRYELRRKQKYAARGADYGRQEMRGRKFMTLVQNVEYRGKKSTCAC